MLVCCALWRVAPKFTYSFVLHIYQYCYSFMFIIYFYFITLNPIFVYKNIIIFKVVYIDVLWLLLIHCLFISLLIFIDRDRFFIPRYSGKKTISTPTIRFSVESLPQKLHNFCCLFRFVINVLYRVGVGGCWWSVAEREQYLAEC